ncbi:hypothetical protein GJAV_G00269210 [Gymnothorax javanicus]|nr:hypothetical protein GJAV_G00269210 [Gymnothorax javanicus]
MPYKRKAKKRAKGKRFSATDSLDAALQEDLLVPLPPGSGTFEKSVLPVLQNCYFYPESGSTFQYSGPHLVKNHSFQNDYQSFHAEKLEQGYTEQELEESFGFLVFDQLEKAQDVCKKGLQVGHSSCSTLGDPSKGVYVLMHSDFLGLSSDCNEKSGFILILRLTKGRAKPVQESCSPPTAGFDCHIWEPITDESTSSSALPLEHMQYYLYERKGPGLVRPRQVLPFALVAFSWTRTLQEESSPANAGFHYHPWRGQLQIKSLVYHVTLRSDTQAAIPIQLPPVLEIDRVMKVSALRQLLSPSVFETRVSCEVSQEGRFFSLYEVVVTSLVRGSSLAMLTLELKKKELALVLQLNDFGFLVLLSSTYFLKYQGKAGTLLAMFVFPDSRAVKEGTKILRSRTSLLPNLLHILPGLHYAETEVEKCPPDQGEALCDMVEQHLQRYSTLNQPGMPVDVSGEPSGLQDQYDMAELENYDQSGRKSGDVTLQHLQTYLGQPGAYTLPVGRAKELVAVRREEQEDNIDKDTGCCFSPLEDTPPALTSLCGDGEMREGVPMSPRGDDAAAESLSSLPKGGENLAGGNPSLKLVIRPIYKRRHNRKWKRKKRKRSRLKSVDEHLGQDGMTEARPEAKQLVPLRRKGFNYGLKTIITDCGKMFIPHGSEVLPKDIASLEERQRAANQCPEQMVCELPGPSTFPKELADLQAPDNKKADEGSLDPKQAEQQASSMESGNELRTGVPEGTTVSPEVEWNESKNSGTNVIPGESSSKGIKGFKPIISFQELRTVFQNLERKLKCPDGQTLDRFDPGLADGEPQQKKVKVDGCTEEFLGFGKDISPRGMNSPQLSPKMTNLSDSDPTLSELLGKQQRTDGQEKTPPRRTSLRRQDLLESSSQPDQSLQAEKSHGLPATMAKPAKLTQFKKPRGSRSDVNSKGNGPLKRDKLASRGSEPADRPQPQELRPGELQVCSGGESPVLEPDSTSACQPADALTLLADLALGSSSGKPPKNLHIALIRKFMARRRRPVNENLPPRSPAPVGLVVSGQFIPLISEEHSYAASSTHGPPKHSLQGLVETFSQGERVQCSEPLGQETSNAPKVTNPSRRTAPPQHPVTERHKRGSRWTRSVVQVGEKICVTRPWKEKYEFGQDSRYNSEPAVKAVLRALHGPWNFGIEETFQQTSLILHIWIGLFYSKSTARFFPDDPNESGPLILKARKKSQGGEALPAGASSSTDPLDAEELQGCAPAPQCPEEVALDLREGSKRVADPSDPCPAALDLSKKRFEALDLSVASKHGSGICPPSGTNKIFPKNALIPLPPSAPCSYTHVYVLPLLSKYPEFVHKEYRPSFGLMSDDESEQEDDGRIHPEDGCGVNSGILEPVQSSSDSGYTEICEHTASLDISKDNVPSDTRIVDGNSCSDRPLQSLDRESNGWTEPPQPVDICCTSTEASQTINICPTATEVLPTVDTQCTVTEDLHPINTHHTTAKELELMEASTHEFKGIVATTGYEGKDFSKTDRAASYDGKNVTTVDKCPVEHDGINVHNEEMSAAGHDGNDFATNEECAVVNDGNEEEAGRAEKAEECTVGNDKGEEEACPVEHDGSDVQKQERSTAEHDAGDFYMVERYTAAQGGSNVREGEALETICDVTGIHDESSGGEMQTAVSNQNDCSIFQLEDSANVNQSPALTEDDVSPELNFVLSDSRSGSLESENCFLNGEGYDSRSATPTLDEPCDDLTSFTNDSCSKENEGLLSREIDPVDSKLKPESSTRIPQSGDIPFSSTTRTCSQGPSSILDEHFFSSSPASGKYSEDCPTSRPALDDKFSSNSCMPSEDLPLHVEPTFIHSQACRPHDQQLLMASERIISVSEDSHLPVMLSLDSLHGNHKESSPGEPSHRPSFSQNDHSLSSSLPSVANHQHATVLPSKDNLHPPNPNQLETTELSLSSPASDSTSSVVPKAIDESQGTPHRFSSDSKDGNMVQLVNSGLEVLPNGNNDLLRQISDPSLSGTSPQHKLNFDCLRLPHQPFSDRKDVPSDSELLSDSEPTSSTNCRNTQHPAGSGSACPSDQGSMTGEPEPTGTSALTESLRHGCWNYKKCGTPGSTWNTSVSSSSRPHAHYEQPGKSTRTYGRRRRRKGGGDTSLGMARREIKNPLPIGDDSDPASQYTTAWDLRKRLTPEEEQYTMLGDQESLSSGSFFSANEGEDSRGSLSDEGSFEEQDSDEALDYSKSGPYNICSNQCDGMVPRRASCSASHRVNDSEVMDQFFYRRSKRQKRMQTEDDEVSAIKQPVFSSLHCRESRPPYKYHPITRTVPNKPSGAAQIGGSQSSHLNCLLQKWEEPHPTQHNLTQASLNLQYLIFAEKMNQVLKNHQVSAEPSGSARYVWRKRSPSHVDCSPCGSSGTLQISRYRDRISEEPIRKRRVKRKGLGALEFSTSCSPIDATPPCLGRLSDADSFSESCSAVSNIGDECPESYRATMNDVWLGEKLIHRSNKLQSRRIWQPHRTYLRKKIKEGNSLYSNLKATNRQSCKGKFRFYIMVTSTDAFFEQIKELLEAEGHLSVESDNFDLEGRSAPSPLLVIVRNEDIADHLCTIPHLLDLKRSPGVLFAGVDQPDDVINHTYQELLRDGGFTVYDADTLSSITLGDVRRLMGTLEELNAGSKWKWFLHYKDSRELRERARRSSESRRLKQYVDRCQEVGLVEVMPYHECDVITRDQPEYLRCLVRLQVQHTASRFPVFITEMPEDSFGKCGILAMNLSTFLRFFRSYNSHQNLNRT